MITRKQIQTDVAHGGLNNPSFNNQAVPYYQCNNDINHCDKFVTDADFNYDDTDKTLNVTNAHATCDLTVDNDATVCNDLNVKCNTCLEGTLDVDGVSTFNEAVCMKSTLDVDDDATFNCNTHTLLDSCIEGELNVDGETTINNKLNVNGTTTIAGDLYVKGTSYEEHATDLYIGSDFLTLRDGAEAGLDTGEKTGIIINNYDGNDSLGIVTDSTGTLRIGEFNTQKVFTVDDVAYYKDKDLTEPIEIPSGKQLFPIGEEDPETGLKEYYFIVKDDTEPVATRSGSMNDHQLVCWNATGCDMHTIGSLPQNNGAILQYDVDSCTYCHLENPNAKGRLLTYDNECDKLKWSATSPTGTAQIVKWDDTAKEFTYLPVGNNGEVLTTCTSAPEYHWAVQAYNCNGDKYFEYPDAQIIDNMDDFESSPSGYGPNLYISWEENLVIDQDMGGSRPAFVHSLADTVFGTSTYGPTASLGTFLCEITWEERQAMTDNKPDWWELSSYAHKSLEPVAQDAQLVWKCQPSNYVFNTMSEYTSVAATIPANSQITILCETNYTTSEEV